MVHSLLKKFKEWFVEFGHCINNQFYEAAILEVVVLGKAPMCKHVAESTFAVRARCANILDKIGFVDIFWAESIKNLFQLHTRRYIIAEIREVQRVHNCEPRTTAAAIVVNTMWVHFFETSFRKNCSKNFTLWFYNTHLANVVARVMKSYREIILRRI